MVLKRRMKVFAKKDYLVLLHKTDHRESDSYKGMQR